MAEHHETCTTCRGAGEVPCQCDDRCRFGEGRIGHVETRCPVCQGQGTVCRLCGDPECEGSACTVTVSCDVGEAA